MNDAFHRLRVQVFCYATEDEDLIYDTLAELTGTEGLEVEVCSGEHGNRMVIMQDELKGRKVAELFSRLPAELVDELIGKAEERVDDDCNFHMRIDKQEAVQGRYVLAHHGDVISLTGKLVSHPARKSIAVDNLRRFLEGLQQARREPSEERTGSP